MNVKLTHISKFALSAASALGAVLLVSGAIHAAQNSSGNKGVIMQKRPAPEAPEEVPPGEPPAEAPKPKPAPDVKPVPEKPVPAPPQPRPVPTQTAAAPANWPAALNQYFNCSLENPSTDEALSALVTRLNRATLLGTEPELEAERFGAWLKQFRKNVSKREGDTQIVEGFYANLTQWVSLESEFAVQPDRDILKRLVKVVQSQAVLDPSYDEERKQRIINTIEQQGLFVPSGILFGYSVLPYRAVLLPKGYVPFESPMQPTFSDTANRAEASYDFIEAPGPIFRVDFDTLGAGRVAIEQSGDGKDYQLVQEWKSAAPGGVRGPAILAKLIRSRYMRVAVESQKETAVLRNPRVFALKEPPAAISTFEREAPVLDGSFKETPWPRKAQIDGFVNPDRVLFAEAQTTVRVCHTADALYVAVYAREPRMSTMACALTGRDAPLWQEESVAIVLRPKGKPEYRFVVNPLGAQFDSEEGNEDWDGEWRVAADTWPVGWSAEIEIPFTTLDAAPGKDDWEINVVRTRRNVENERSIWVYSPDGAKKESGLLIF